MKSNLQQQLFAYGKTLYSLRELPLPDCHCMNLGIQCPDRWFRYLGILTQILEAYNQLHPDTPVLATDVTCKNEILCFHFDRNKCQDEFIENIIGVFTNSIQPYPTKLTCWEELWYYPELVDTYDFDAANGSDIAGILANNPRYVTKFTGGFWDKLNGDDWASLLASCPRFAEHCNWGKLSLNNWREIRDEQPQLIKQYPFEFSLAVIAEFD